MDSVIDHVLSELPDERKESRISARVPARVKEIIDIAAELSGATATQFLAQAAYQAAQKLIEHERIVRLSARDTANFLDLLDNPPEPSRRLKAAVSAYKQSSLYVED